MAAAKGAFQAGQVSFNEGDYARAITYWEDAFRRDCSATTLLKNLARAYESAGNKAQAVVALETYLERTPNAPDKDQLERRIDVLKRQLAEAEPTATPGPDQPGPGGTTSGPDATTPSAPEEPSTTSGGRPLWPLYVAGGGLVLGGVGLAVFLPAQSDVNDVLDKCPDFVCPDNVTNAASLKKKGNDALSTRNIGTGLMVGGGLVMAGGLVWYFLQPVEAPATASGQRAPRLRTAFAPVVSPQFSGWTLSGTF